MAGPGGGPPRRSHTKSRKGCEACKRRHIRCDETFPQCRNCTKHKSRCPYQDMERSSSPNQPDLMWTPEIEAAIEQWKATGMFPFPELQIYPAPDPQKYDVQDLRLIHYVASISHQMGTFGANNFTLWTRQIPTIIKIGVTYPYVMDALLAFSAMLMAFQTDCPVVGNASYEHRGKALSGLHEAIGDFSRESSDAILAASLVLSWQAMDWRSWTQLMQGTRSVMGAMDEWKLESQFIDFIKESCTFPTAPPSPKPDHKPSVPHQADIDALQRTLQQLQRLESYLKQGREDTRTVVQLISFLKGARKVVQNYGVAQQFERLRELRTWLFTVPVELLQQTQGSASALLIIAHYYTVALVMERVFPEIGAAYFGSLSLGPVEEIARRMMSMNVSGGFEGTPLPLMEFPIDTVKEFRSRMGWAHPTRTPSFPQFNPPNFYQPPVAEPVPVSAADWVPPMPSYSQHPAFSYSTEDLSIMTHDGLPAVTGPMSAISPLQLSSPFPGHNYLNIPSPSYGGGGGFSPASSGYGEFYEGGDFGDNSSAGYSDHEDFGGLYEMNFGAAANSHLASGSTSFGVGTPTFSSTTPTFPPPEGATALLSSSLPAPAPSPFLRPEQFNFGTLPPPESPSSLTASNHRHNLSVTSAPPSMLDLAGYAAASSSEQGNSGET